MDARARRHILTGLAGLAAVGVGAWLSGAMGAPAPPPFPVIAIERRADAPVPRPLAEPFDENRVVFHARLRRSDLGILARHAGSFSFNIFSCVHDERQFYATEIFLRGQPIRRFVGQAEPMTGNARALLEREAADAAQGPEATLVLIVPRMHVDHDRPTCGRFSADGYRIRQLSVPVRIPQPGPADLAALGIVPELVRRPAGLDSARFAEQLVAAEAARRRLPPEIWDADRDPISSRESSPNHGRAIVVYFPAGEPAEHPGRVCRLNAVRGGLNRLKAIAYRGCAALLGIAPAAEPPPPALITYVHGDGVPPPVPAPPPPPVERAD